MSQYLLLAVRRHQKGFHVNPKVTNKMEHRVKIISGVFTIYIESFLNMLCKVMH